MSSKRQNKSTTQRAESQAGKPLTEADKQRKRKESNVKRAFKQVAKTEAGRIVFRYFLEQCGFHAPSVNIDPVSRSIIVDNTVYNEARRNIYLDARKLIPQRELVKIEFNLEAAPDEDEDMEDL